MGIHTVQAAWRPIQLPIKTKRSSCNSTAAFNFKLEEMNKKTHTHTHMILAIGARCEDRVESNSWLHASGMNVRRVRVNCAPTQRDWLDKCREKNLINYVWPRRPPHAHDERARTGHWQSISTGYRIHGISLTKFISKFTFIVVMTRSAIFLPSSSSSSERKIPAVCLKRGTHRASTSCVEDKR